MSIADREYPCLRPLEAIPDPQNSRIVLRDPTQLAAGLLVVGETDFTLLTLLDGRRGLREIQADYARHSGRLLLGAELDELLDQLEQNGFLEGPGFERYYGGLVREYQESPYRPLRDPESFGTPVPALHDYLDEMLADADADRSAGRSAAPEASGQRLAGIVTPHLDFPRGQTCYGAGYLAAAEMLKGQKPRRVVVLGTNHFGRADSVNATTKDFQTPWGVLRTDREFLARLEDRCGGTLTPYELDHLREHSVELQTLWIEHVFGSDVAIVPVLCPDPSGPHGTRPRDPGAVDLRRFAVELGRLVREDPVPTVLVASADLSHVGGYFGDRRGLDDAFLDHVRRTDEAALQHIDRNGAEDYRQHMAGTRNPTRVCSVGCLYALMTALGPDARAQRLRYHQAVTAEEENCVTCAAYGFWV